MGGVRRAKRTDVPLCCSQLLLLREKPQKWSYNWARLATPAAAQEDWECQAEMCQAGTGAGCVWIRCAKGWDRQAWLGRCRRVLLGHASNTCEKAELAGRGLR